MPHFSDCCGSDEYVCQVCGGIFCGQCVPAVWRKDITKSEHAGNVCPTCLKRHEALKDNMIYQAWCDEQTGSEPIIVKKERPRVTQAAIRDYVKTRLSKDPKWALRALVIMFERQTASEQVAEQTSVKNGVGFGGVDAELLSSFAKQYMSRKWLSDKQMGYLFKKIHKYWKQIVDASDKTQLEELVIKEKFAKETVDIS
jgi:hypothetical protein